MDCIYNTGGFCFKDNGCIIECQYIGDEADCKNVEES